MVGYKHIPQIVTGTQAEIILNALPKTDCPEQKKSLTPLPDKFTVDWKREG